MWRLIRWLFVLIVIAAAVLIGYAFFADLEPPEGPIVETVTISSK